MDEPLRVFIADDEAPARARLRTLLRDCGATLPTSVIGEAESGASALAALQEQQADVVLLDIRMPGIDGMDVARRLGALPRPPAIVFVTAYDAHAVTAFELEARDYLLKPVRLERLVEALRKVRPVNGDAVETPGFVTVNDRGRVLRVPIGDALFLRAEQKYVTLRTREREFVLDDSLVKLEEGFPDALVRIHRNCLIGRAHLVGFELRRNGEESQWVAILRDWPERLPVSRRQAHVVREFRGL